MLSHSVWTYSLWPHGLQPTRLLHPWDFPGKSTGVGCHCLLHYMKLSVLKIAVWFIYWLDTNWCMSAPNSGPGKETMMNISIYCTFNRFIQLWQVCALHMINSTFCHIKHSTPRHIFDLWCFTKFLWKVFNADIIFLIYHKLLKYGAQSSLNKGKIHRHFVVIYIPQTIYRLELINHLFLSST